MLSVNNSASKNKNGGQQQQQQQPPQQPQQPPPSSAQSQQQQQQSSKVSKLNLEGLASNVDFVQLTDRMEKIQQGPPSTKKLLGGETERGLFNFDSSTLDRYQMPVLSARANGGVSTVKPLRATEVGLTFENSTKPQHHQRSVSVAAAGGGGGIGGIGTTAVPTSGSSKSPRITMMQQHAMINKPTNNNNNKHHQSQAPVPAPPPSKRLATQVVRAANISTNTSNDSASRNNINDNSSNNNNEEDQEEDQQMYDTDNLVSMGGAAAVTSTTNSNNNNKSLNKQHSQDIDPDLEMLQAALGLRTGEHAIEFFGKNQSDPRFKDVKVLFFNRATTGLNFRPYDLLVVNRTERNPEYFTMSSAGVVHVQPGVSSEFVPLGTWWRHSSMFNAIRSIPFFKNYLHSKTYQAWSSNVRYQKYSQIRKQLTKQLFVAKKAFCPALRELASLCYELRCTSFMSYNSKHVYQIEEFENAQATQRGTASKQFEQVIDKIQALLEKVGSEVSSRVEPSNENGESILPGMDDAMGSTIQTKRGEKSKSMQQMKQEAKARAKALELARQEVAMLPQIVRLADYMVVESLLELTMTSSEEFLENLQNPPKKTGFFLTTVSIGRETQSIDFSPTKDEVSNMIQSMTDAMITACHNVPRVLYMISFKPYFRERSSPQGPHLVDIIRNSEKFNRIRGDIERVVATDFSKCKEYGEMFEDYRPIFMYGESFDQDAFANQDHIANSRVIKKEMLKLKQWGNELDRMKLNNIIGIFHVDSKTLRNSLVSIKDRCLEQMKFVLHDVARLSCLQVLQEFHNHIRNMQRKPSGLKEFAQYVEQKNLIAEEVKNLMAASTTVDDMYRLLGSFEVKIPPPEQVKLDDLHTIHQTFMETLQQAESDITSRMPSMSMALDKNINALDEELLTILATLNAGDAMDDRCQPKPILAWLQTVRENIDIIAEKAETYTKHQTLFKLVPYEYTNMRAAVAQFEERFQLWQSLDAWESTVMDWRRSDWSKLNPEEMSKVIQETLKTATKMFKSREDDRVALRFKQSAEAWKGWSACLMDLGNSALRQRHWDQIFAKLQVTQPPDFTLENLIEWNVFAIRDFVGEVSGVASGEHALEIQLNAIQETWKNLNFNLKTHRDYKDVFVLVALDDIYTMMEDHQASLQTMLASRYVLGIRDAVEEWDKKLALLSETMDEWLTCQRNWMYLESIFNAPDIQKQLPTETVRFLRVDQNWKDHMRRTNKRPNVIDGACHPGVLQMFQESNKVLEEIQKSLEDYLETKRTAFPRFYFLSNDELLEILSQTRDPRAVKPHLRKCFDSMASVEFEGAGPKKGEVPNEENAIRIVSMSSAEGETVQFDKTIACLGNVEHWMLSLESVMRNTLCSQTRTALEQYTEDTRERWLFEWPAQCVMTVDQVIWTSSMTKAINDIHEGENEDALKEFLAFSIEQIDRMVVVVRGQLTPIQRGCICNLIVVDVHARDVVDRLVKEGCNSITDFAWICQLRYYWESTANVGPMGGSKKSGGGSNNDNNDNTGTAIPTVPVDALDSPVGCVVRQTNASFLYAYEYLGVQPRLVITPLTDKCFMTLTGALNLLLGGAPAGPAGTGKTESVKDLGKALAQQVVVFNCSDGLDYKMMGRFFSGLAQAGAWACFDEFNRIDIEVLSVIAQQILTIQQALKADKDRFEFEGREMGLKRTYGCFITMNPGYAGRTELPDNLKALFRPMAMMVPDYALIAEIMLFSEGFQGAKELARKMTAMYRLASEQLSSQDHYDFGMRAVKSVLVMAGSLKRSNPDLPEDVTLIRALRDSNVPKFLADDIPLFMAIVGDLFPGVELPTSEYTDLLDSIHARLTEEKLQVVPSFVHKIIQLYETMQVRHGVMLVGVTAIGKTTTCKTLGDAMTALKKEGNANSGFDVVHRFVLNPKSIRMGELYGEFNLQTNEWTDGLIASIVRQGLAATDGAQKWVICDGPVDAVWIESMNTVLDDNKTLCLNNGERIKLPKTMRMVFEVNDLAVASPATVSRCGMVYLEPVYLGWRPLAMSWLDNVLLPRFPEASILARKVTEMLDAFVNPTLEFIRHECKEHITSVNVNLVMSLLRLLESLLVPATSSSAASASSGSSGGMAAIAAAAAAISQNSGLTSDNILSVLDKVFVFSLVWSLGGNLHDSSLHVFDRHIRKLCRSNDIILPPSGLIYDYSVDIARSDWVEWKALVPSFTYVHGTAFFDLVVPTGDMTRTLFLLKNLLISGAHVLIGGPSGVGKTVVVEKALNLLPMAFISATKLFSAQTSAANLQAFLEEKLEKLRKNLLGPPSGKSMVFFIDDLNMPQKEIYGAQPPIELLRQVINTRDDKQGGFYDRKKVGLFKKVSHTQFVAACAPPGGGRSEVTPRLLRHFNMLNLPDLSENSMVHIFGSILSGFLGRMRDDLALLAGPLVDASVEVYRRIASELLPTPSKSHYTFNLRDLAKVVQGMLMVEERQLPDRNALIRLWVHESARVFQDRLVDNTDKLWFCNLQRDVMEKHLTVSWKVEEFIHVLWGDFLSGNDPTYIEILDLDRAKKVLRDYADDYALTYNKPMNLVFFRDAVEHVARVSRVLRQPRGNCLLVGVGGSGRQSLARLAAHAAEYKLFQIELTRTYGVNDFHEDLKKVLMTCGCSSQRCVFLINDTQLVKESFLEDINNLLNAGEVPDLFAKDETEKIVEAVRPLAKDAGKILTRDVILAHFVQLVRENLHIVLAMSPVGDAFRNRLRQFPSLVNCCTIDWYTEWPEEALVSVASSFFQDMDFGSKKMVDNLCRMCYVVHSTVSKLSAQFLSELRRHTYTTPTSYLELLNMYLSMLQTQRKMNSDKIARYQGGVSKLVATNEMVELLQADLRKLAPVLVKASNDTAKLLEEVTKDRSAAKEVQNVVEDETRKVNEAAAEAQEIKDSAQKELDEALPAFQNAVTALRSLNKNDITEIKSFQKPPQLVMTTMEAVCILRGVKPDWDDAKKLLAAQNFLQTLEDYDKDNIPEKILRALGKYVKNPEFRPENVEKVSKAAKSLCMWVHAMDTYARVARNVEPKRMKLQAAEVKLSEMQQLLSGKQAELTEVQDRVAQLEEKLAATMQQRDDLQQQSDETQARLQRAEQLMSGLGGERARWERELVQLSQDRENLIGNILVAAGVVAYAGPFTAVYRSKLIASCVQACNSMSVPVDPAFSLERIIGDPVEVRDWALQGLPSDPLSVENGIILTRGRRWPLLIDPQTQANRWIRNMERPNKLSVVKLTEATYMRTIENCIRVGNPVLLENVGESLDPALEPVLQKQTFKQAGRLLIRLGDTDVDYSPSFRFYVTSKLPNPHYPPEVCVKVTVVNFTVTPKGLEDQLLAQVVGFERPELEEEKGRLVVEISDGQKKLKEIEDKILKMLAESSENILDDHDLIATLAASKTTSQQINEQVVRAEKTKVEIDKACEAYRPVALRGSILYFVIADMGGVDPMYQYSLQYFIQLFQHCMEKSERSPTVSVRVKTLLSTCTADIYTNICRGLFERNKRMFSFLIGAQILRASGAVTDPEWRFFLNRGGMVDESSLPTNPAPEWIRKDSWAAVCQLQQQVPSLSGLGMSIASNTDDWQAWYVKEDDVALASANLPDPWGDQCTRFQGLCIIRALREEKTVAALTDFILEELGPSFVESPPFDLHSAFNESGTMTPIIFALSPGADPISYLIKLAEDLGMLGRLRLISLGQGQGPIAAAMIAQARDAGEWVCLQNCHLAASWMPELEKILESHSQMKLNDDFRLWLTSMPSKAFPVSVLQSGIKLTNEPPKGLRANLKRTYENLTDKFVEACAKPAVFRKLLFSLAFFHAVVQERRKFGAIGWNIPYEWNNSDLQTAQANLRLYLDEQEQVPFETLKYVVGEVNYGGRITDSWDQRCAHSLLAQYICPQVLKDNYTFTLDGTYYAPPDGEVANHRNYIDSLPLSDAPEVFGLHRNANITFENKETRDLMATITSMQPRAASSISGMTNDDVVAHLASDLASRVPVEMTNKENACDATFAVDESTGSMNSLGTFLLIELGKFNRLLKTVAASLREIQRAIKGQVVMSSELDSMYNSLLLGNVPNMWSNVSYLSVKPLGPWVKDLVARVEFLNDWVMNGPPSTFWLSAVFFPQGFMTAALQMHARKTKIPIDTLDFHTEIRGEMAEDVSEGPESGVYVHGLFLEGARWSGDSGTVAESNPGELFVMMPIIWLEPMLLSDLKTVMSEEDNLYRAPFYKVSTRAGTLSTTGHSTNFVRALELPTKVPPEHWVRRGVALLSQLDD